MTHRCSRCAQDLPEDSFYRDHLRDELQRYCKTCLAEYKTQWDETQRLTKTRLTEPEYLGTMVAPPLKRTFKVRKPDDRFLLFRSLIDKQKGLCPICQEELGAKPVLDRDSDQGIRGLLCPPCRLGIEGFGSDPHRMRRAIKYLENR